MLWEQSDTSFRSWNHLGTPWECCLNGFFIRFHEAGAWRERREVEEKGRTQLTPGSQVCQMEIFIVNYLLWQAKILEFFSLGSFCRSYTSLVINTHLWVLHFPSNLNLHSYSYGSFSLKNSFLMFFPALLLLPGNKDTVTWNLQSVSCCMAEHWTNPFQKD